ncbi:MAG: hypothetical protein JNL98_13180 [Bryobacterales bacterium]|nr:hypothetical protein [Bryobacterales bacterium]
MSFHPTKLPLPMQEQWVKGPSNTDGLIRAAAHVGLYDVDFVASAVFYLRHPERNYRKIEAYETMAIAEWKQCRAAVQAVFGCSRPRRRHFDDVVVDGRIITAE